MKEMRPIFWSLICIVLYTSCKTPLKSQDQNSDWRFYNGSHASNKYVELDQINRKTLGDIKLAWTYDTHYKDGWGEIKCNPIIIDGVLYGLTRKNLFAIDATNGKQLWYVDFIKYDSIERQHSNRGLVFWSKGEDKRIFCAHARYLYAINANNGSLVESFGEGGRIRLSKGMDVSEDRKVMLTTPGVVYEDYLILGSFVWESLPAAPGDIRAFNAESGELEWIFHTIPHPGEFGYETWPDSAYLELGGANNWAGMSVDDDRGIVYVPTGSATYDFYGANRKGQNLFANTLLALDAKTGKRIWHYQIVHHDLWDRDLPCAPNLLTVEQNGKKIDAVAQATKHGYVFLFDRVTGKPLFEIDEVPVPPSVVPGEQAWPTQPIPRRPPPFMRVELTEKDLPHFSKKSHDFLLAQMNQYDTRQFAPPDTVGVIVMPEAAGGVGWGGASVHEPSGTLVIPSNEVPGLFRLKNREEEMKNLTLEGSKLYTVYCSGCHGKERKGSRYIPSLEGVSHKYKRGDLVEILEEGIGKMPAFKSISEDEREAIAAFLMNEKYKSANSKKIQLSKSRETPVKYTLGGYDLFEDEDGLSGITSPLATLSAFDMNKGELLWQVPFGKNKELENLGMPNSGIDHRGGAIVTKDGLIIIAASVDRMFRIFDLKSGEVLWSYKLPGSGIATPSTYMVDGKQYLVIAVTIHNGDDVQGKYMAFSI